MEENESLNLDLEYKRFLQILRPYLTQVSDENVITICNAWIQRLSICEENEKALRNKYMFSLCYQLAKGYLEEPFTQNPPRDNLPRMLPENASDGSSTESECYVIDAEMHQTEINSKQITNTEHNNLPQGNEHFETRSQDYSVTKSSETHSQYSQRQNFVCYPCPKLSRDSKYYISSSSYEHRASNLIKKLREIKTQNMMLQRELLAIKEESTTQHDNSYAKVGATKVDCSINAILKNNDSSTTVNSLKCKLQEVQDSRNNLIEKIYSLQEVINNFNDLKKHEIDDIEAKHKLEIINTKELIRHEIRNNYEKKIDDLRQEYESKIDSLKNKSFCEIEILSTSKEVEIGEKNKIILAKDDEITKLNNQIEDLKSRLHSVLEKFIDKPICNHSPEEHVKFKAEQLEKRLNRIEKNKIKCTKAYETKVAQLQRDKHLAECTLQLQMVRQRTQIVNEVTDENQKELAAALEKLETKYKEIVANVQATAIQRRMQDQIALESILQAACGITNENNNVNTNSHFTKTMRNPNPSIDGGMSSVSRGNKVGNICMGNKSFVDDSVVTGYCMNGERMGELFERVYVPQRDNPESTK